MSKFGIHVLVVGEFKTKAFAGNIDLPFYYVNWKKKQIEQISTKKLHIPFHNTSN